MFAVQVLCAAFFVLELLTEVMGLRHWALPFAWREVLQVLASLGLILGAVASGALLRRVRAEIARIDAQVRAASGEFFGLIETHFDEWSLSPSERDVALFAIRGFSNSEIANLRNKSEATIKTQMNAVLRKAGVSNRAQLLALFVDVLIAGKDDQPASTP